jgi:hypothetical protein
VGIFTRTNTPDDVAALKDEFTALRNADSERLCRYRDYRDETEAGRDETALRFTGGDDYGQRSVTPEPIRHSIPLPFGQAMTVKHSYRIAGRLPDIVVDRREESPQERYRSDTMEKMLWGIIRESKGQAEFADAAWDASQLGAACFSIYFDYKKQMPLFRALDPAGVLVVKGLNDPHEFQRFYRFWEVPKATFVSEYRNSLFRGEPVQVDRASKQMVTIVECADPHGRIRFQLEDAIPLDERKDEYGFTPYVVVPNIGPYRKVWGWADYEFVRALVQYFPQLIGREADIIRSVANGTYVEKGTGQNPGTIVAALRKGGVIPARRDGTLEPVNPPQVPGFVDAHRDTVMQLIRDLGFAPAAAWGDGNAGSGSDRGLQLGPQLELSAMKQINWANGLSRLAGMAFQMIEAKQTGTARYRGIQKRGARRSPFNLLIGPDQQPVQQANPSFDAESGGDDEFIEVPRSPKELFDGDHDARFEWQNRIDPDDPAFALSELNKFQQGLQSAHTTLERLGCESPEDELKLIEQENDRFPWMRQGMIALIRAQLAGQGQGGGPSQSPATGLDDGLATMLGKDGQAMNVDGGTQALGSSGLGQLYGGA